MIACKHCTTHNSLDSVFCRRCGTALAEEEIQEARAKNEALVAEGVRAFNDGKTEEAMTIAQTAVEADPSSATGLALKGMCHERHGQIAEALDAYERIVELNPDSTLDKIKLNQLRNALAHRAATASAPDRRLAGIAAIAATTLVIGIGGLIAVLQQGKERPPLAVNQGVGTPAVEKFVPAQTASNQGDPEKKEPAAQPGAEAKPTVQNPQDEVERPLNNTRRNEPNLPSVGRNTELPAPDGTRTLPSYDPNRAPVEINPGEPDKSPITVQPKSPDPDPVATTSSGPDPKPEKPEDQPIMQMSVRRGNSGGGTRAGGGDSNGVQALVRTANAQFEVGNYAQAASTYERALRSGADPGLVNQRLGQTLERQGKKADALMAYERAVQALEAAQSSGKGDPNRIKNALESVRQARRALGGG